MVSRHCPRLVLAGTGSGVGKTSLALGLVRALVRRGLRVQTFKVGPDFLDPTYLAIASGRTCYNLDGWMSSREYVDRLFDRATADADLAVVEGVMGLFDGASPVSLEGSTAEIAQWLDAPVILVAEAHGVARSLAAVVKGFAQFDPTVRVAGAIANRSGSARHAGWLAESLAAAEVPPLVGAVPRDALPTLESRHLGLVTADSDRLSAETINRLADACQEHLDLDRLLELAGVRHNLASGGHQQASVGRQPHESSENSETFPSAVPLSRLTPTAPLRIGIARDEAFHFYYPDNLEALTICGVEWAPFSPLADVSLPDGLDAIYLGGGYPEVFAGRLSENHAMLDAIRRFVDSGRAVYAECGGLMYLGQTLQMLDGRRLPMAGVLPIETAMRPKLKTLGYVEVAAGDRVLRGHEFHYSEIVADETASHGWQCAHRVRRRRGDGTWESEGFAKDGVVASYIHLHWASCPESAWALFTACECRS